MTFDYTDCENLTPQAPTSTPSLSPIPNFSYRLRTSDAGTKPSTPQYAFIQDFSNPNISQQNQCILQFEVPADLQPSVLLYYKLTNFFQNHRTRHQTVMPENFITQCDPDLFVIHLYINYTKNIFAVET